MKVGDVVKYKCAGSSMMGIVVDRKPHKTFGIHSALSVNISNIILIHWMSGQGPTPGGYRDEHYNSDGLVWYNEQSKLGFDLFKVVL